MTDDSPFQRIFNYSRYDSEVIKLSIGSYVRIKKLNEPFNVKLTMLSGSGAAIFKDLDNGSKLKIFDEVGPIKFSGIVDEDSPRDGLKIGDKVHFDLSQIVYIFDNGQQRAAENNDRRRT